MNLNQEIKSFAGEVGQELAVAGRALFGGRFGIRGNRHLIFAAAGLFLFFQQVYFWTGKELLLPSGALYMDNGLYGWDSPRVVDDLVVPGHNARSNVHPLFVIYAKPAGAFFNRLLNLTKHTSAIAVASCVGALNVVCVLMILYALGGRLPESAAFAALFGASTTNFWLGAIPETGCFSILSILIVYLLSALALRHGVRSHVFWILSGLFTYGNAVTNFLKSGIAFVVVDYRKGGALRTLARAAAYGAIVVTIAVVLTLWAGSSLAWTRDKWVATPDLREAQASAVEGAGAGDMSNLPAHLVRCFFAHTIVAPTPVFNPRVVFHDMDGPIVMFNDATYGSWPGALTIAWLALAGASLIALAARRDAAELRFALIVAGALAWDFAFFSQYYVPFEGVFVWSPHYLPSAFMLVAFLVPALARIPRGARIATAAFVGALALAVLINNFAVLRESVRLLTSS